MDLNTWASNIRSGIAVSINQGISYSIPGDEAHIIISPDCHGRIKTTKENIIGIIFREIDAVEVEFQGENITVKALISCNNLSIADDQ